MIPKAGPGLDPGRNPVFSGKDHAQENLGHHPIEGDPAAAFANAARHH
jgi:hypothetical protein